MEDKKVICPCCGQETLKVPAAVPESVKDAYVACMLSGEPYKQRYSLYNGKLNIIIQDLTREDVDELTQLNVKAQLMPENTRDIMQQIIGRCYRMLPIIAIQISLEDNQRTYPIRQETQAILKSVNTEMNEEDLQNVYNTFMDVELFGNVPEAMLDKVLTKHILQSRALIESGFDDSFYQGIAHVS